MKYASLIRLALTIALGIGMAFVEGADPFDLSSYEVRNRCTADCASLIELTGTTPTGPLVIAAIS